MCNEVEELNSGLQSINPDSGRVENFNQLTDLQFSNPELFQVGQVLKGGET